MSPRLSIIAALAACLGAACASSIVAVDTELETAARSPVDGPTSDPLAQYAGDTECSAQIHAYYVSSGCVAAAPAVSEARTERGAYAFVERGYRCDDGRTPTLTTVLMTDDALSSPAWLESRGEYVDTGSTLVERVECEDGVARPYRTSSIRSGEDS